MPASRELIAALQQRLKGEVRFDPIARLLYRNDASIYEIEPEGVVAPQDLEDVVHTVELARQYGVAVLPRGSGTSLAGQAVGRAIHLDFSRSMNRILEVNEAERWVRVQPGVVLDELNAHLRPRGLLFGPDVATSSRANIGGMIGNNSCGAHSLLYGKTIDHVLELEVVLAEGSRVVLGPVDEEQYRQKAAQPDREGRIYREVRRIAVENGEEIRRRFPRVMRRVSGYNLDEFVGAGRPFDLSKIAVGSEGTLCAVVEARLKLVERPLHRALVACHFADLAAALEANIAALETGPSAVELTDKILLDQTRGSLEHAPRRAFLQGDPQALLFVEYCGDTEDELRARMDQLEVLLRRRRLGYAFVKAAAPAAQESMWALRKAGLGLLMGMRGDAKPHSGVEDTCVPVEALPEYAARVQRLMEEYGLPVTFYGHASVGVLHIRPIIDLKDPGGVKVLRALQERMSEMVGEYGGTISAEHGDGLARSEWIEKMFGARLRRAFEQVKEAFDPEQLMNPGKIVRAAPMDRNLRYGPGYGTPKVQTFFSFEAEGGLQSAAELCSGVGHCRKKLAGTMCPSYMATLDEKHSTRGRANALRAALSGRLDGKGLSSEALYEVMDLCLECKACKAECPSSVDMAKLKYEFLAHYCEEHGYPLRSRLFAGIDRLSRWGSALAPVSNWVAGSALNRWLLDRLVGIDRRRRLPPFARERFSVWFAGRPRRPPGARGRVVLFNDTFVEYSEPQIGMAATLILESAGFEVVLPEPGICCGRPLISKGFLRRAKARARANVERLAVYVERGWPIVGLEPSCVLSFRDDYLDLVDDGLAGQVAAQVYLLEEFLVEQARKGTLDLEFTTRPRRILLHGHCHQKALAGTAATLEVLNMPPRYQAEEIPSGCCGMAGSFGYEKEHYELSRQVGEERLFKVIRAADPGVEIAAVGTSCRQQIADFAGRRARHWAEILVEAL